MNPDFVAPPELCFRPGGEMALEGGEIPEASAGGGWEGAWLLGLAAASAGELPPGLRWARAWASMFLTRLCQTRDLVTVGTVEPGVAAAHAAAVPPIAGAEYVVAPMLVDWWASMAGLAGKECAEEPEGLAAWMARRFPEWHLVGRVTFHLAENKTDTVRPFAFLATYTDGIGANGQPRHLPLARALQQLAGAGDRQALDRLLEPVRLGSARSARLREWLETKRLFQPMAWSPGEAFHFLREIPVFQESGIVVKTPDWWKSGRPPRPQVTVSIDAPKTGTLDARSLLQFKLEASLDGEALTAEELEAIRSAAGGLVSLRGRWVEVDGGQLQQVLAHWQRVEAAHRDGGLDFHLGMRMLAGFPLEARGGSDAAATADLLPEWSRVVAGKNLSRLLEQMGDAGEPKPPAGLKAVLRPYQLKGLGWLDFLTRLGFGACLADDMGLGKTVQVIALFLARQAARPAGSGKQSSASLLVVPASLVGNWKAEFARFAPSLRVFFAHPSVSPREDIERACTRPAAALAGFDVMLTTYQFLQRTPAWKEHEWDLVILDEAQAIKNPGAGATKASKALKARGRVAMTGTPVENRPGDLWSLFDFLNPGLLGGADAFARAVKNRAGAPGGFAPIRQLVQPYILRRLKTDRSVISDLPDKTEIKTWCGLTKRQAKIYARLVEELARVLADPDIEPIRRRGIVLGFLMKFKQVCNHPSHWNGDGIWNGAESGKFLRLAEIAGELAERGERVLVFTQFQETCAPLARHLAGVFGRDGLILHGGTPVKRRAELVEDFQRPGGPPFFVISVKAGGTGLNLTAASHVIHFDRWWNPAVENQATDRAFRIGQKKNVFVHKFICQGTMEERIDLLIDEKKALAGELIGNGGAEALLTEMDRDALLRFVSLDLAAAGLDG